MEFTDIIHKVDYETAGDFFKDMTDDEILKTLMSYYSGTMTLKDIIKESKSDLHPSALRRQFPKVETSVRCEYDNEKLYMLLPTRQEMGKVPPKLKCLNCGHTNETQCSCQNCIEKRKEELYSIQVEKDKELKELREKIKEVYSDDATIDITEVSAENRILLAACLQGMHAKPGKSFGPYLSFHMEGKTFFFNTIFAFNIFRKLENEGIIKVSSDSDIDAFKKDADFPNRYYPVMVNWNLHVSSNFLKEEELFELLKFPNHTIMDSTDDVENLWKEIVIEELMKLFEFQSAEFKFEYRHENDREKVATAIQGWLKMYTPSQIYFLIWLAVRQANDDRTRGTWGNYRYHPIDFIVLKADNIIQRRSNKNLSIESYGYPHQVVPDLLTKVFFDQIVLKPDWFTSKVPEKNLVEEISYKELEESRFYEKLEAREVQQFNRIFSGAEYFYITTYGIAIFDGVLEWLFSDEKTLYKLSKIVGGDEIQTGPSFYHNLSLPYYVNEVYSTTYLLELIKSLIESDVEYFIPDSSQQKIEKIERLLREHD